MIFCCSAIMPSISASGRGGHPGHVHVDRDDLVDALHHAVVARVRAAVRGAGAHRDHPLGVRHLLVQQLHGRRHLLRHRAGHDHHVRLARRRPRHDAEAVEVVARHERRDHLDGAAGEAERHRPERRLARNARAPHRPAPGGCRAGSGGTARCPARTATGVSRSASRSTPVFSRCGATTGAPSTTCCLGRRRRVGAVVSVDYLFHCSTPFFQA